MMLEHLLHPLALIRLFNSVAMFVIAAAWLASRGNKRLISLILLNYLLAFVISFGLAHFDASGMSSTRVSSNVYYLIQAGREVIILAFLLEIWMQNKAAATWCKAYLAVIGISISCNLILSIDVSSEVGINHAGKGGFRAFHYYVNQFIPLFEVVIAWGSADNFISRLFKRSSTSPVESALVNDSSGKAD